MTKDDQKGLNRRMTGKAFQSRARAHALFIFEQRKNGNTWREIVDELAKRDCIITLSALRKWSIRYIKRPLPTDQMALMEKEALQLATPPNATPITPSSNISKSISSIDDLLTNQSAEQNPWSTPKSFFQ